MRKLNGYLILAILFIFASCGKKGNENLREIVGHYVSNTTDIASFGKISIGQIKDQAQTESIPMFGKVIASEYKSLQAAIDLQDYIYYSVKMTAVNNGEFTVFAKVNNADSLQKYLKERGNTVSKENNVFIAEEDDMLLAFNKEIVILRRANEVNKVAFVKEFKTIIAGNKIDNKYVDEALASKSPIALTINNANIVKLNQDEEMSVMFDNELYKDVLQLVELDFNKGSIDLSGKFLADADKLKKFDFRNTSKEISKFKVSGKEILNLALNADFARIEKQNKKWFDFALDKFDEEVARYDNMDEDMKPYYQEKIDQAELIKKHINRQNPLTSLSSGVLAITADKSSDLMKPAINVYLGSSNKAFKEDLIQYIKKIDENADLKITANSLEGKVYVPTSAITYSKSTDFDENMMKFYLDMNYVTKLLEFKLEKAAFYTKPFKSIEMYGKDNVFKMTIHLNNTSENALAHLVKYYTSGNN